MNSLRHISLLVLLSSFLLMPALLHAQQGQMGTIRTLMYQELEAGNYSQAVTRGMDLVSSAGKSFGRQAPEVGEALETLADLYLRMAEYAKAMEWYRKALAHRQGNLGEQAPETARTLALIGKTFLEAGEPALAKTYLQRSIDQFAQAKSAAPEWQAIPLEQMANLHYQQGHFSQADSLYQRVMRIQEVLYGMQSAPLARSLNNVAAVYLAQGQEQKAFAFYTHALNMQRAVLGKDGVETATTLINMAVCHDKQGDFELAEVRLKEALVVRQKWLPTTHPLIGKTIDNLVSLYLSIGRYVAAEACLNDIRQRWQTAYGADDISLALINDKYAAYFLTRDQPDKAVRYMKAALTIRENRLGLRHDKVAANLYNIGKLHNIMGQHPQARIALLRALDIFEADRLGDEASLTAILAELALTDMVQGKMDDAETHLWLMHDIKASVFGPGHPQVAAVLEELLKFYRTTDNVDGVLQMQEMLRDMAAKTP